MSRYVATNFRLGIAEIHQVKVELEPGEKQGERREDRRYGSSDNNDAMPFKKAVKRT